MPGLVVWYWDGKAVFVKNLLECQIQSLSSQV